jgi:cytochrome c biogenesis protein CcmG/thiol:disulfide interchange protein DsbE
MKSPIQLLVLVLLSLPSGGCGFLKSTEAPGPALEGQVAPDFSFSPSPGRVATLKDFRGRVVLINFWATWCTPCRDEMPSMNDLRQGPSFDQLVILAFSVDRAWDEVNRFMSENQFTLPVYADFDRKISTLYGTRKFPETYIIDKKGKVALKVIGSTDWMDSEMLSYLRRLMAELG